MIRALPYKTEGAFRSATHRGSVFIDLTNETAMVWFLCPCGCGTTSRIRVGEKFKPDGSPSWEWNGSIPDPTLTPSIKQTVCGWHGVLRDGYWEAC
ncbi:hypothetical protein K3727_09525 [Rhodobacteraceae bacterium M382]|nr:hypothetical protein K3727_09525 [Rhodobacteraceae bacterium M382]